MAFPSGRKRSSSFIDYHDFNFFSSILDPGKVPEIVSVTRLHDSDCSARWLTAIPRFPGNNGILKVPSVIYYDQQGNVRAVGAETMSESVFEAAEAEEWVKSEWLSHSPSYLLQC